MVKSLVYSQLEYVVDLFGAVWKEGCVCGVCVCEWRDAILVPISKKDDLLNVTVGGEWLNRRQVVC